MVCFLTGYASCAASASLPAWPAHRKARSAPRAHVRELLCVSQSSKERLRRSRTESSGAAPAIEELPGTARQCKARRAACGEAGNTVQFSHGRGGLEGARPSSSREHQILAEVRIPLPFRARTAEVGNFRSGFALAHPKKSEISVPVSSSSIRRGLEGAWPSGSHDRRFLAEDQPSAPIPTTCCRGEKKKSAAPEIPMRRL